MQPIPYPELASSGSTVGAIVVGVFLLAVAALFGVILKRKREQDVVLGVMSLILALLGFITLVLGFDSAISPEGPPSYTQTYKQTEAVQKEIQKSYGVKLSFKEAGALEYPAEAPKTKFKVYGSFEEQKQTEGKAFESHTVYLVWSDGSLGLSESSDGKSFTPLEPKA